MQPRVFVQGGVFEPGILGGEIVLRLVAEQGARVGYIEALEAVVAQAVEDREPERVVVDGAHDNAWLHAVLFHHSGVAGSRQVAPHVPDELTREGILSWVAEERPDCLPIQDQSVRGYLTGAGYRVPEDLGFAMLDHNAANEPDFAGMNQRHDQIGAACADLLVAQINRNEKGLPAAPLTVMIDGVWVPGATVRPRVDSV